MSGFGERRLRLIFLLVSGVLLAACNSANVRPSAEAPVATPVRELPAHLLPEVGVDYFVSEEAGGDLLDPYAMEAESRYLPWLLVTTLQNTRDWGAVRINPGLLSRTDVEVRGQILRSDGQSLALQISVQDATGREWFSRRYEGEVERADYRRSTATYREPFQAVYERIAADMLAYRARMSMAELAEIKTVSQLRFAAGLVPDVFANSLVVRGGRYRVNPDIPVAEADLARLERVRERDYLFIDTLQDYHANFSMEVEAPYYDLRRELLIEGEALRRTEREATLQTVGGVLAVFAGILAQGSDSAITRAAGVVGIGAGALAVQGGLAKRGDAKAHASAIQEISRSFADEMDMHQIELEDRSVTLRGTLREQSKRWQRILREIYQTEAELDAAATSQTSDGQAPAQVAPPASSAGGNGAAHVTSEAAGNAHIDGTRAGQSASQTDNPAERPTRLDAQADGVWM